MNFFHTSQRNALNQSLAEVQGQVNVSFEFFPPRIGKVEQTLWNSVDHLSDLRPKSISVVHGINSGEHDHTHSIIKGIGDHTGLEAAPHLACIGTTPVELRITTHDYWNSGTHHIMALRDDLPPGSGRPEIYTPDLVTLLKEVTGFDVSVTAYPEMRPGVKNARAGLFNLRWKVDTGASRTITQFFFNTEDHLCFHNRYVSTGIDVGIIPGILSVSNFEQTRKFASMTNVRIPAWITRMSGDSDDDAEAHELVGANIAIDMAKTLNHKGVKDFRFYTLNHAEMSYAICHTLGARPGL